MTAPDCQLCDQPAVSLADSERIEVFGLCGVGKSFIMRELGPLIAAEMDGALTVDTPVDPGGARTLGAALQLLARIAAADPVGLARFCAQPGNWWLPLKLGHRMAGLALRPARGVSLLIDSGILQPFVSIEKERHSGGVRIPGERMLARLPRPAVAIYVRAPVAVALQRFLDRERTSGRVLRERDMLPRFQAAEDRCKELAAACRSWGSALVVIDVERTPNRESLQALARRIGAAARTTL